MKIIFVVMLVFVISIFSARTVTNAGQSQNNQNHETNKAYDTIPKEIKVYNERYRNFKKDFENEKSISGKEYMFFNDRLDDLKWSVLVFIALISLVISIFGATISLVIYHLNKARKEKDNEIENKISEYSKVIEEIKNYRENAEGDYKRIHELRIETEKNPPKSFKSRQVKSRNISSSKIIVSKNFIKEKQESEYSFDDWFVMGEAAYNEKKFYDAVYFLNKAISKNQHNAYVFNQRGLVYDELEKYDEAIADYDLAIKLKPDFDIAYYNQGVVYGKMKKHSEAIQAYTKSIEINDDDPDKYLNRGLIYEEIKEYSNSLEDLLKARSFEYAKNDSTILLDLAEIYFFMRRYNDLKEVLMNIGSGELVDVYIIKQFYIIISKRILEEDYSDEEKEYEKYLIELSKKNEKIDWDFVDIEEWLKDNIDIDINIRAFIQDRITKLKCLT